MKYLVLIITILLVLGCEGTMKEELDDMVDTVDDVEDKVLGEEETEEEEVTDQSCPTDCDDGDSCTLDYCTPETEYKCVSDPIIPCCGNAACEIGEDFASCGNDCPECVAEMCQNASFDYETQICSVTDLIPCCGNAECEPGETYASCPDECPECSTNRECYKSVFDFNKNECVEKPRTPCCGNDICDVGESCTSCEEDCECIASLDLGDYPDFLEDGTLIVVGDTAKSQDSLTGVYISTNLLSEGIDTEPDIYSFFSPSKLKSKDLIVLGDPCDNALWEEFQGVECDGEYFDAGRAVIKLIVKDNREIVFVAGNTEDDTKKAADYLIEESLSGMEIDLDTSGSSAKEI